MNTEFDLLKHLSDSSISLVSYMKNKHPDQAWMLEVHEVYFKSVYEAHQKGIPLILIGPNFPPELIYAFGAVPLVLDCLPIRMAADNKLASKYVDIGEQCVPSFICSLNKVGIGVFVSGDIGKPDAVVYSSTPCDSGRAAYTAIADYLGVPSFCVDTPFKQDERGYNYIGEEIKRAVTFLEGVTGHKLDWSRLAEVLEYSNQAYELLAKIAELRQHVPCPLPGRFLVMNMFFGAMVGRPEIVDFLQREYDLGKAMVDRKRGCVKGEEKYRIIWLQNLPWYNVGILDYLENECNAVVTMDGFGYLTSYPIDDPWNETEVFRGLGRRMLGMPMTHGSSGPVEPWLKMTEKGVVDYKSNLAFFAGHVGCKHTWAVGKQLEDMLYNRYGIRTLTFDLDCVDTRYKTPEVVKETIKEFMDTIKGK